MSQLDLTDLAITFAMNTAAMGALIYAIYFPRHQDRELATTAAIFNTATFAVLGTLAAVEFSLAAGFGLFAILALFNLRSEPIDRVEIAYFFAAVAIAVICSVPGPGYDVMAIKLLLVLVVIYAVDHPAMLRNRRIKRLTVNDIDSALLSDPAALNVALSARLGINVTDAKVEEVNLTNGSARISLCYRTGDAGASARGEAGSAPAKASAVEPAE